MKKFLLLPVLMMTSIVHADSCDTSSLLQQIRPGASWNVSGTTITWLDNVQVQPTPTEMQTALTACQAALTPSGILSAQRTGAVNELTNDPTANAKFIRAVFLVELDEINLIRSLLVPSQTPRTVAQFKTAVQNKINSGSAD